MAEPAAASLCAVLVEALRPAVSAFGDARLLASWLHAVDPALDPDVTALADVVGDLAAPAAALLEAVDTVAAAVPDLGSPDEGTAAAAADRILAAVASAVEQVLAAAPVVSGWDAGSLGLPDLSRQEWTDLFTALVERLLADHLEQTMPVLYGVLRAVGLVVEAPDGTVTLRPDRLGRLVTDPTGLLAEVTGWGGNLDVDWFTGTLTDALGAAGPSVRARTLRPAVAALLPPRQPETARELDVAAVSGFSPELGGFGELGILVAAVSRRGGTPSDALLVTPLAWGAAAASRTTPGGWSVSATLGVDASATTGVLVHRGGQERVGGTPAADLVLAVSRTSDPPWRPLGSPASTRLEVGGVHASVTLTGGAGADPDVVLVAGADDTHLIVVAGSSFLAAILGAAEVDVDLSLEARWSGAAGFTVGGGPALSVALPLHVTLGPVTLDRLTLAFGAVPADGSGPVGGLRVEARVDLSASLGPFAAIVAGLGVATAVGGADGTPVVVGPLGLEVVPLPPQGIGLSLEAEAISAEGLLLVDGERWVGGLSAEILAVGVDVLVVVDTSPPADPGGFALLASLSLRFPGIPLGFGFSLTGLGGLLALGRRVDAEALALGLRDGAADAILFPADLLRDIDVIVGQVDQFFPLAADSTVVGPVAEISWGVPIVVRAQVGVVVALPDGLVVVLGSVHVVLPDEAAPVLELHLDVLGVLDVPGGTLLVTASLYDSRLLGVIELSGDAAVYASWLSDRYLLVSVGGYHPGFQPPSSVPAVLESLRRMRADIDLGFGVTAAFEAYVAVTSNTVQFGGRVEIQASAEFLLVTYTARGWFELDVLLRFSPFAIVADASAGVAVYAGDRELLGVRLSVHLEGPQPWFASGDARFDFFGIKVRFDFSVGGHAPPQVRGTEDVLELVRLALAASSSWSPEPAAGLRAGIALAGDTAGIRPDDVLVGLQAVAPLERTLDRVGELTPEQSSVSVTGVTVAGGDGTAVTGLDVEDVLDWFAPAMFDSLPDTARLSAPSYEEMVAGVRVGAARVTVPDGVLGVDGHETDVWEPDRDRVTGLGIVVADRDLVTLIGSSAAATVAGRARGPVVAAPAVDVGRVRYQVVEPAQGLPLSRSLGYAAAVRAVGASAVPGARVVPDRVPARSAP